MSFPVWVNHAKVEHSFVLEVGFELEDSDCFGPRSKWLYAPGVS